MAAHDPGSSQVRILTSDSNIRQTAGAGILISDRHILTCAHVVKDLADANGLIYLDFPLVSRHPVLCSRITRLFFPEHSPDPRCPEDICVLTLADTELLPHGACPAPFSDPWGDTPFDCPVRMCGFPATMEEGDLGDWSDGRVKGKVGRGFIQIDHDLTSRDVAPGFSGTAVWDKTQDHVAGMIVSINTRDDKTSAYMIPVSLLAMAWPELTAQNGSATAGPGISPVAPKLCNRDEEDLRFSQFFCEKCEQCPNTPQFYILPGKKDDCHDSLIDRFSATRIDPYIRHHLGDTVKVPYPFSVPWPTDVTKGNRRLSLRERLINALGSDTYAGADYSISDLCDRNKLHAHRVIIIVHDILASGWDKDCTELLNWYVTEYWAIYECREDFPLFLIFFNLKWPGSGRLSFTEKFKMKFIIKPGIEKAFDDLEKNSPGLCLFRFDDLKMLTEDHVYYWFGKIGRIMSEKEKKEWINKIFKGQKQIPMAEIEGALEQIVAQAAQKTARQY